MPDLNNPADLEAMIKSLGGVPVVHAAWSTYGLRELDAEEVGENVMLYGTQDVVRVATGQLTSTPLPDDPVNVDGQALEVAHAYRERDGAWTRIVLADPGP